MRYKAIIFCALFAFSPLHCEWMSARILRAVTYVTLYGSVLGGTLACFATSTALIVYSSLKFSAYYDSLAHKKVSPLVFLKDSTLIFLPPTAFNLGFHFLVNDNVDYCLKTLVPRAADYMYDVGMKIPYV